MSENNNVVTATTIKYNSEWLKGLPCCNIF